MTTISNLANLPRWLSVGAMRYVWVSAVSLVVGLVWLLLLTGWHVWRRTAVPPGYTTFIAGLAVSYLFMPLVHHTLYTDGYYYITDSDNFFSKNVWLQLVTWLIAALLSGGITRLRRRAIRT
jgi:hypothetical protein